MLTRTVTPVELLSCVRKSFKGRDGNQVEFVQAKILDGDVIHTFSVQKDAEGLDSAEGKTGKYHIAFDTTEDRDGAQKTRIAGFEEV